MLTRNECLTSAMFNSTFNYDNFKKIIVFQMSIFQSIIFLEPKH